MSRNVKCICAILCAVFWQVGCTKLVAYLSQHGLHGEIHFLQYNTTVVEIRANLETTLQYPEQAWSWGVSQFPVDYSDIDPDSRCSPSKLGSTVVDFDEDLGYLVLPGNETSTWLKRLNVTGKDGIWSKSLVLVNYERKARICATITSEDSSIEHMAEVRFRSTISGSIYFRWLSTPKENGWKTVIYGNLYHVNDIPQAARRKSYTEHSWKIYVTDIFEHDHHRSEDNCNFLQQLFDPQGYGEGKALGDLDVRSGKIKVATDPLKQEHRVLFTDSKLALLPSDLTIPHRTLYLVIMDSVHPEDFIACAKVRHVKPLIFRSFLNVDGVKGNIMLSQRSLFDPTVLNFTVMAASKKREDNVKYAEDVAAFRINELPPSPQRANKDDYCASTKSLYNPGNIVGGAIPPPGFGTQDQYPVGDISGKLQSRNKEYYHNYILPGASSELSGIYWDVFLPLNGKHSVAHRSVVLYKYDRKNIENITEVQWGCSTLLQYDQNGFYQKPMFTAQVLFRYPVVGRVLFRQPKEEPWYDTTVLIEYLIHADGSTQNTSHLHRWAIHLDPPGKDFYNWSDRCLSAGSTYNPYKISFNSNSPQDTCNSGDSGLCRLGDLFNRLGSISIAGNKLSALEVSRKMFIDNNLPLSGGNKILGKSLVLFDDFGPKARGERLACALISGYYSRKAVARDWYSNGDVLSVKGKLEVFQQSEYDVTNIELDLKGLMQTGEYHVHMTPVEANLAFPCEKTSLYGIWNPRNVDDRQVPIPSAGSTDQYQIGDLSGKFGTLENLTEVQTSYNDTNLPLFGYESIIGRSVVIHKKNTKLRWVCSTIESGYSPSEAREIRAIASFHHPAGYAYGYIRMQQVIYSDGSASDTVIEVKLRHPGKNDRNITRDHHWQIFVNPVGVDAAVKQTITRCVAGGYVWNPYYTQLADPLNEELYHEECKPDNPLRCYVGDVSARVGKIDLGDKRVVLSDSNFPLEGPVSALGRSIVIFGANSSGERYACANIEPDHDIIKYINLQKPPRFVVAQFLEDVRHVTEAPEWMLNVDARTVKTLHGGACIQMIMHFKGPYAHQLEVDLSGLLAAGILYRPSIYIPGYANQKRKMKLPYRTCEVEDPNEKNFRKRNAGSKGGFSRLILLLSIVIIFARENTCICNIA